MQRAPSIKRKKEEEEEDILLPGLLDDDGDDGIRGGGSGDVVTSINRELGRDVPLEEVKQAFTRGFSEALGIIFT